jgi:hypothetical protein
LVIYLNCTMMHGLTNLKLYDLLRTHGPSIRRREPETSLPVATARRALNSAPVLTRDVLRFSNKRTLITLRNVNVRMLGNFVKGCSDRRLLRSGGGRGAGRGWRGEGGGERGEIKWNSAVKTHQVYFNIS